MDNLNHIRTLLEQIRSTTKPVDESVTEPIPEWEEAFGLIDELLAEKPSAGTALIADALKGILDKDFPKAELNDAPVSGRRMLVFKENNNYYTIVIE